VNHAANFPLFKFNKAKAACQVFSENSQNMRDFEQI